MVNTKKILFASMSKKIVGIWNNICILRTHPQNVQQKYVPYLEFYYMTQVWKLCMDIEMNAG